MLSVKVHSLLKDECAYQWWPEAKAALSRGRHFKEDKKFRPVHGHLNALQLSISVHQRCSVTFKMHQIHIRPGLRQIQLGSSPHS